jgi:hypothetical protein
MISIYVSWDAPLTLEPIQGYVIGYRISGSADVYKELPVTSETNITISGLQTGTNYEGYIKSFSGNGIYSSNTTWTHIFSLPTPLPTPTPTPSPTPTPTATPTPSPTPTSTPVPAVPTPTPVPGDTPTPTPTPLPTLYNLVKQSACADAVPAVTTTANKLSTVSNPSVGQFVSLSDTGYEGCWRVASIGEGVTPRTINNNYGSDCECGTALPPVTPTPTPTTTPTPTPTRTNTPTPTPTPCPNGCGSALSDSWPYDTFTVQTKCLNFSSRSTGDIISISVQAQDRPNRFSLRRNGGTVAYTDWLGFANYDGPWGSSLNNGGSGTLSTTYQGGDYELIVDVGPGNGTGDAWNANVSCGNAPTTTTVPQASLGKRLRLCDTSFDGYYTPTLTTAQTFRSYGGECYVVGEDVYVIGGLTPIYGDEGACSCESSNNVV